MKKRSFIAMLLALVLSLGLAVPAAAQTARADTYTTISTSGGTTAAIKTDGSLWMWGSNRQYQLGNGGVGNDNYGNGNSPYPIQTVPVKVMDDVAAVSCASFNTAAIKTDGSLWTWGWGVNGALGDGKTDYGYYATTPVKIMDGVAAVSCGYNHTAAIKTDGSLWMWGDNGFGQLGNGGQGNFETDGPEQTVPVKVMDGVAAVSCGTFMTAIIKTDGSLWMCGSNSNGAIGNGQSGTDVSVPVKVMDDVVSVSADSGLTAAVKSDGTLWAWGNSAATGISSTVPVQIMEDVSAVSSNGGTIGVIKTDGTVWMWGANSSGQLGNGGGRGNFYYGLTGSERTPVQVLEDAAALSVRSNVAAVKDDGTLWMWGDNLYGQGGNGHWGTNNTLLTPTQILTGVAVPAQPSPTVAGFNDVHESDYFADAVVWAKENDITGGTTSTTFSPGSSVTRAQAMTFLWRAAGRPEPASLTSPFTDVSDPNAYYYKAVLWAAEQGITNGVSATTFGTGSAVAYDQMLAFLSRAAGADTGSGGWSQAALNWAAENGLTDGLTFSAKDTCPRSDVVYCLWKQMA